MALHLAEFIHGNIRVVGHSLAGEETFVVVPEMNIAFDLGRAPREIVNTDHVFLSHGHMDHAAGVAYYFSQRKFVDNAPGNLYVPAGLEDPIRRLLRLWAQIDGMEPPAYIHVAQPGEDIELRRDLIVRPFAVKHPCRTHQTLGFAAIEVRQKLKSEHHGLTGPQIVELKRQGVEITQRVEIPLIAYCGDTAPGPFLDLEYVRSARVLLLECTFVEPDHLERARAGSHMHVSDLPRVLARLNNERIVLTHLSRRTALGDARRMLRAALGGELPENVSFLMESRARKRQTQRAPRDSDARSDQG